MPSFRSAHLASVGDVSTGRVRTVAVAISPDHQRIVTARADGVLQIGDTLSGSVRCIVGAYIVAISSDAHWAAGLVVPRPDGDWMGSSHTGFTLWDLRAGKEAARLMMETPEDLVAAVSRHGVVAALESVNGQVLLWDHAAPRRLEGRGWPAQLAFSPDGRQLLAASSQGSTSLFSAPRWRLARAIPTSPDNDESTFFLPHVSALGSALIAIAGQHDEESPIIEVWAPTGRRARFTVALPEGGDAGRERAISIPANGLSIASGPSFAALAFSPDDRVLAAGADGVSKVLRYDARTGAALPPWPLDASPPVTLAYSGDGAQLVTVDADGRMYLFDARTGARLASSPVPPPRRRDRDRDRVEHRSPDGSRVLVGSQGKLTLTDGSGQVLWTASAARDATHGVRLSPSAKLAWTGGSSEGVMFDAINGKELWRAPTSLGAIIAQFTPDGRALVMAASDGPGIFDAQSGRLIRKLVGAEHPACIALSPDGKRVAAGFDGGAFGLWDVDTGKLVREAQTGDAYSAAAAFSPDGRRLISVGNSSQLNPGIAVRLWNGETGAPIDSLELTTVDAAPTDVAFRGPADISVTLRYAGVLHVTIH